MNSSTLPPKEALVRPWTCEGYTEHFNFHKKSLFGDRFGPQRAFGYARARVLGPFGRSGASAPEGEGVLGGHRSDRKLQKMSFSCYVDAKCSYFAGFWWSILFISEVLGGPWGPWGALPGAFGSVCLARGSSRGCPWASVHDIGGSKGGAWTPNSSTPGGSAWWQGTQ
jgi:hypothetical protein